jgi:hypothetical protein
MRVYKVEVERSRSDFCGWAMGMPAERRPDGDLQMSADHLDQRYPGRIGS